MVLAEVPIQRLFGGNGTPNGSGDQAPGLIGAALGQHAEGDASGNEFSQSLGPGNNLATGGENAGDGYEVTFFDAGITQSQLKGA